MLNGNYFVLVLNFILVSSRLINSPLHHDFLFMKVNINSLTQQFFLFYDAGIFALHMRHHRHLLILAP